MNISRRRACAVLAGASASQWFAGFGLRRVDAAPPKAKFQASKAYEWLDIILEATAREVDRNAARPTIIARTVLIPIAAMYDAWSRYDMKAASVHGADIPRRPSKEHTLENKVKAIAHAAYQGMLFVYGEDAQWIRGEMLRMGFDPNDQSSDPTTPVGVGNLAAACVAEHRRHDGANQFGDEVGSNGKPYSDWTYYEPRNPPDKIYDPDRWQPIPFDDGKGGKIVVPFLTPHWYRVKAFGLERNDQFRPGPPPKVGDPQLKKEVDEVLAFNASLNPEQKSIVEFMRDGPRSTGQSGHWLRFAQDVSRRDRNDLDRDIKLFFTVANVAHDAFISSWDAKRYYDSSRPWTLVRYYYKGKNVRGWAGPGKGVIELPADTWHPYSPSTFITPPFPGYTSGHSTVSGACSKVLELFTGSDHFGEIERRTAGVLTEPGHECKKMQAVDGKLATDPKLTCNVALKLPTFSATADMAGISRIMGGYHIQADNIAGLSCGRAVAKYLWPKCKALFEGKPL